MKRASILDVARKAQVSKTTVSHVVNGTRFVEEDTRARVMLAIQELNYRPSAIARSLTTQRTGIIGVVVSDASNYFFSEVLQGVEEVLLPANYALIMCNTAEALEREAHYLNLLISQRVDGIIAGATSQQWSALSEAEKQHTPIVFIDRSFDHLEGPFVAADNEDGAYQGVRHLLDCGHRRIGILAGLDRLSSMRKRMKGYQRALAEAGLTANEDWIVHSVLSFQGGREAMRHMLSLPERPSAVFINNNLLSLGALLAIKDCGLRCPQDVSLVGFDDHPWAAVSDPPLTVVRQPARKIGQVSAEMILALIHNQPVPEKNVILACDVVERQSCRPFHP
jgi:LacI family transcriptional regulator